MHAASPRPIPAYRRLSGGRLLPVALLLVLGPALALAPTSEAVVGAADVDAEVVADDVRDAIVGSGGLVLPPSVEPATRREVAGCPGCAWRISSPCVEGPLGNAFEGQETCLSVTRGCQVGSLRRTWFRPVGEPWREIGLVCLQADPVTVESVGDRVRQELVRHLPAPVVERLPRTGVVTGIPTIFSSGQSDRTQRFSWRIAGRRVTVVATPTWVWRFPDGSALTTDDPGSLGPDGAVRHVFRRAGTAQVACASRWTGEYTVDGLGPFPIPGAVTQETTTTVPVGEGRALLTP